MLDPTELRPTADRMSVMTRRLRIVAIVVPLALLAMVSVDGISWTDIEVIAVVAVMLWLFVLIATFTIGALTQAEPPPGVR